MAQRKRTSLELFAEHFYDRTHEEKGDMGSLSARLEFESILQSDALSPRDRQIFALRYCIFLGQKEIANLLNISQQSVSDQLDRCFDIIESCLRHNDIISYQVPRANWYIHIHPLFDEWNEQVLHNDGFWWRVKTPIRQFVQQCYGLEGEPQERTDYNEERANGEYTYRLPASWLGKDRTYKGQRNEVRLEDEWLQQQREEEAPIPDKKWPIYPHDGLIKKDEGFWSANL